MPATVNPIPKGFHTVTPSLCVRNAADAIEFYKKALGAKELVRMKTPDGRVMHAELQIGDSIIFLSDEFPEMGKTRAPQTLGGVTGVLNLYVEDVDTSFKRAVDSGSGAIGTEPLPIHSVKCGVWRPTKRMYRRRNSRSGRRISSDRWPNAHRRKQPDPRT
jgi:uncharacterized glyoxalase superfamily protein PhnB